MKSLGVTISSLRKEKGMTQNELAEKMNVTDKAVSKWERDLSCPDVNPISKLADVLGVSVEELLKAKKQEDTNSKVKDIFNLILNAVAMAMGIAVVVLTILGEIDVKSSIIMLGIGVACVGFYLLENKENEK